MFVPFLLHKLSNRQSVQVFHLRIFFPCFNDSWSKVQADQGSFQSATGSLKNFCEQQTDRILFSTPGSKGVASRMAVPLSACGNLILGQCCSDGTDKDSSSIIEMWFQQMFTDVGVSWGWGHCPLAMHYSGGTDTAGLYHICRATGIS